jgi:hypothetical protein
MDFLIETHEKNRKQLSMHLYGALRTSVVLFEGVCLA